jgi:large subunit ribosomal protein L4e
MNAMKFSATGEAAGEIALGKVFNSPVRIDLIRRAVLAEASRTRQPYGADPMAGKRTSARYSGRRGRRGTMANREMARIKRITNPGALFFTARFVSQSVKGRKAHPPKTSKIWDQKINTKEWANALRSAIAATAVKDYVIARGHAVATIAFVPFVVDDKIQEITRNKDAVATLSKMGLIPELLRVQKKKHAAGKAKRRGRRMRQKVGPLVVVAEYKGLEKACRNIPGVDVVKWNELSVNSLAPGAAPGRLCIWTESALKKIEEVA